MDRTGSFGRTTLGRQMTEQTPATADGAGPETRAWRAPLRGQRTVASRRDDVGAGRRGGSASRDRGAWLAAGVGLCLGLLALGPGLWPGYLLSYDMVFVPGPPFNSAVLGTGGTLPRAVPSDAVMAALARIAPADAVQKVVLLAIFVLACAGAARLLSARLAGGNCLAGRNGLAGGNGLAGRSGLAAQLAAGMLYAWNPFVAERLILGQWATLLGYAGLPWVLAAASRSAGGLASRAARLAAALVPAGIGGFAAMSISGLVAVPAACQPARREPATGHTRVAASRWTWVAIVLGILGVLSLPWLVPALARHVATSPAGVAAFAARADTPFGTFGSLIMLGGAWNAQTVPAGYGGPVSVLWLVVAAGALAGFVLLGRHRWPGLAVAAPAGFVIAMLGAIGPGQDLLRAMIGWWPGFAVLRDGQQFVAPLALAEALGLGLVVARVLNASRPPVLRESRVVIAAALIAAPVLLLPGLAWGAAGRLRPVEYPADWIAARQLINADLRPGKALLLPWAAYRRFGWNQDEAVLDPWPRLLERDVIWNDGVQVGSLRIPPEDPQAVAISGAVSSGAPLTTTLRADGYRYVIVDAGFGPGPAGRYPFRARLPGCRIVLSGPGLVIYQVPG
jgi:hypothetical protein